MDWRPSGLAEQRGFQAGGAPSCTKGGRGEGCPLALLKLWRLLESLGGVRDSLV